MDKTNIIMKMKTLIESIVLFFIVTLALIGTGTVAIIFHEYSHYNDVKELNVVNDEICALLLPTEWKNWSYFKHQPIGRYYFEFNKTDVKKVEKYIEIEKGSEFRAYFITSLVFLFFLGCYWIISFYRYKDKEEIIGKEEYIKELVDYISELEDEITKLEKI